MPTAESEYPGLQGSRFNSRQPRARLLAMICLNIAARAVGLIGLAVAYRDGSGGLVVMAGGDDPLRIGDDASVVEKHVSAHRLLPARTTPLLTRRSAAAAEQHGATRHHRRRAGSDPTPASCRRRGAVRGVGRRRFLWLARANADRPSRGLSLSDRCWARSRPPGGSRRRDHVRPARDVSAR